MEELTIQEFKEWEKEHKEDLENLNNLKEKLKILEEKTIQEILETGKENKENIISFLSCVSNDFKEDFLFEKEEETIYDEYYFSLFNETFDKNAYYFLSEKEDGTKVLYKVFSDRELTEEERKTIIENTNRNILHNMLLFHSFEIYAISAVVDKSFLDYVNKPKIKLTIEKLNNCLISINKTIDLIDKINMLLKGVEEDTKNIKAHFPRITYKNGNGSYTKMSSEEIKAMYLISFKQAIQLKMHYLDACFNENGSFFASYTDEETGEEEEEEVFYKDTLVSIDRLKLSKLKQKEIIEDIIGRLSITEKAQFKKIDKGYNFKDQITNNLDKMTKNYKLQVGGKDRKFEDDIIFSVFASSEEIEIKNEYIFKDFDKSVLNAIYAITKESKYFTIQKIKYYLSGSDTRHKTTLCEDIEESIKRLSKTTIKFSTKVNKIETDKKGTYKGVVNVEEHVLNLRKIELNNGGIKVDGYQLLSEPIYFAYIEIHKQLQTFDSKYLALSSKNKKTGKETKVNATANNIILRDYLLGRINDMLYKQKNNELNGNWKNLLNIRLDTIFNEIKFKQEENENNKAFSIRKTRKKEDIYKILINFVNQGLIKKFIETKNGFKIELHELNKENNQNKS